MKTNILPMIHSISFSNLAALWPLLISMLVLLLVVLWYRSISADKNKGQNKPQTRVKSVFFLAIFAAIVIVIVAIPKRTEHRDDQIQTSAETQEVVLTVHGMDCGGCENMIQRKVGTLPGVVNVKASHAEERVMVIFDPETIELEEIIMTIQDAGYLTILD
jgi:copper chaperone